MELQASNMFSQSNKMYSFEISLQRVVLSEIASRLGNPTWKGRMGKLRVEDILSYNLRDSNAGLNKVNVSVSSLQEMYSEQEISDITDWYLVNYPQIKENSYDLAIEPKKTLGLTKPRTVLDMELAATYFYAYLTHKTGLGILAEGMPSEVKHLEVKKWGVVPNTPEEAYAKSVFESSGYSWVSDLIDAAQRGFRVDNAPRGCDDYSGKKVEELLTIPEYQEYLRQTPNNKQLVELLIVGNELTLENQYDLMSDVMDCSELAQEIVDKIQGAELIEVKHPKASIGGTFEVEEFEIKKDFSYHTAVQLGDWVYDYLIGYIISKEKWLEYYKV